MKEFKNRIAMPNHDFNEHGYISSNTENLDVFLNAKGILLITHDNCQDGNGSEAVFRLFCEKNNLNLIDVKKYDYKDRTQERYDLLQLLGENKDIDLIAVIDYSLDADTRLVLSASDPDVKVATIDHHATVADEFQVYPKNDFVYFSTERCGAYLAWEVLFPLERFVPHIIMLVDDRDRWQWKLEGTKAVWLALQNHPRPMNCIYSLLRGKGASTIYDSNLGNHLFESGRAIETYHNKIVEKAVKHAFVKSTFIDGHIYQVAYAYAPDGFGSDVGNAIVRDSIDNPESRFNGIDFAAIIFYYGETDSYGYSFRSSVEDGLTNVSDLAKRFGGGGHPNAAGCGTDYPLWKKLA